MTAISIRRRHLAEPGPTALPVVPKVRRRRSLVVYICYLWLFILIFAAVFANVLPIAEYRVPVGAGKLKPSFHSLNLPPEVRAPLEPFNGELPPAPDWFNWAIAQEPPLPLTPKQAKFWHSTATPAMIPTHLW